MPETPSPSVRSRITAAGTHAMNATGTTQVNTHCATAPNTDSG